MFEWLLLLFLHKERDYIEVQSFKFKGKELVKKWELMKTPAESGMKRLKQREASLYLVI